MPALGTFGEVGRHVMSGPGSATVDFSLFKNFPVPQLGEEGNVQFRAEFFNIANRSNFNLPSTSLFERRGGGALNSDVGKIFGTSTTARQIQFGLKIIF